MIMTEEQLVARQDAINKEQMTALQDAINERGDGFVSDVVYKRLKRSVANRRVRRGATKFNSRWDMIRDHEGNFLVPVEIASNISESCLTSRALFFF